METYTILRAFADSWFLIFMFSFFIGVWIYAFLPNLQSARDDAALIPLRNDEITGADTKEKLKGQDHG